MATPNQMPKRHSQLRQQLLAGLIETKPNGWNRKVLAKDENGKEVVETVQVDHDGLRFPLAQNVSHRNVERAARRWI